MTTGFSLDKSSAFNEAQHPSCGIREGSGSSSCGFCAQTRLPHAFLNAATQYSRVDIRDLPLGSLWAFSALLSSRRGRGGPLPCSLRQQGKPQKEVSSIDNEQTSVTRWFV